MSEPSVDNIQQLLDILNWQKLFLALFGIFILVSLVRLLRFLAAAFQSQFPGQRIQIAQLQAIISYFIYTVGGIYLAYSVFQPTREIMLATLGSAAVAIGFSLKDLVASLIAGLILIIDRPFQVGDRITHDGTYGDVISIGLRAIRVRTLDDSIVTIPNFKFINESVQTGNAGAIDMMVEMVFYFPETINFKKIEEELYQITATSKYVFLKKGVAISMKEVALNTEIKVKVCIKAYVIDTQFEKAFESEVTKKVQALKQSLAEQVSSTQAAELSKI